jgi:hypothetical protein
LAMIDEVAKNVRALAAMFAGLACRNGMAIYRG